MLETQSVIRVVIADDSEIAATFLERLLEQDPQIRVVGHAGNGAELLSSEARLLAQVLLLDVLMPEVGGLSVIRKLVPKQRVIVVSSVEADSKVAEEALALGASAFFCKRRLAQPESAQKLRDAVKLCAWGSERGAQQAAISSRRSFKRPALVFVVGSTGAISHLEALVGALADLDAAVVVVQHFPTGRDELLADIIRSRGALSRVARDGDYLEAGVWIAPAGTHLEVDARYRARLIKGDPVNGHLPSGDVLLRSAAALGGRVIAVMLSGLGDDGAQAMAALAAGGGRCFALDPRDCQAAYMPRAALAASPDVHAVRAADLAATVRQAVQNA